jgi:phospholipid/cholesterol/gamma-HCH transport system substrate-binding protein
MMEGSGVFLRTGLLILLGFGLLFGIVWYLGGQRFRHGQIYESYFRESVQGLEVGAPVKYRGVTVGRVTEIGLVSAEYGRSATDIDTSAYREVFVRYLVDTDKIGTMKDLAPAIRLGLRARIVSQVLTGVADIELDYVDPSFYPEVPPPWKPLALFLPSIPSTFTQVQDAAQALIARLNKIDLGRLADSAQGLVDELQTELVSGDVHRTLLDAQALLQTTRGAVQQADVPKLSAQLQRTAAALQRVAADPALARTFANSATATARLAKLATQMSGLVANLNRAVAAGTSGVTDLRAQLTPILRDLRGTAANLRATTERLREDPGQLLSGPPPPDRGLGR